MLARYYSSGQGRFISVDPVGGRLSNPQSLNRYVYVLNNPLRLIDPLGLDPEDPWSQLTARQQSALISKLSYHSVDDKKAKGGRRIETSQEAFNRLVGAGGASKEVIADRVATIQNFIAAAGGYQRSDQWLAIETITKVGINTVEVGGSKQNSDFFLNALEAERYQIKGRSNWAAFKEWLGGTSGDHPGESIRSEMDSYRDIQFHYANPSTDFLGYTTWQFHFDAGSSNTGNLYEDSYGAERHKNNPTLKPSDVQTNLIHRHMVPRDQH
jgi:uncharacterized protein RhaS with RHS repeats